MFTVCFLSSAVRCQPLSRALCVGWVFKVKATISLRIRSVFSASWLGRNGFLNNLRLIVFKVLGLPQLSFGSGLC
ncbi:hypothetical protein EXZ60_18770 [Vibrio sp. 1151_11]|nr:hypothetical protein [Vibrio sp. 1151_11]